MESDRIIRNKEKLERMIQLTAPESIIEAQREFIRLLTIREKNQKEIPNECISYLKGSEITYHVKEVTSKQSYSLSLKEGCLFILELESRQLKRVIKIFINVPSNSNIITIFTEPFPSIDISAKRPENQISILTWINNFNNRDEFIKVLIRGGFIRIVIFMDMNNENLDVNKIFREVDHLLFFTGEIYGEVSNFVINNEKYLNSVQKIEDEDDESDELV